MTARDWNTAAESLHGARQMLREQEILPFLVDAREELIEALLAGERIGRGYRAMSLVEILTEWDEIGIEESAQRIIAALNAPGDSDARLGDLERWLRDVAERYVDAHDERIEERAEELITAARESHDEDEEAA